MKLVPCPYCSANVDPKKLDRHINSVHSDLIKASESVRQEAIARTTKVRIDEEKKVEIRTACFALPEMVRNNHQIRQRRYLNAYETGIIGTAIESLPSGFCECQLCGKWGTRSLYRVPLKDGTCMDLAQCCFDALLGINEGNIAGLRAIVRGYDPSRY